MKITCKHCGQFISFKGNSVREHIVREHPELHRAISDEYDGREKSAAAVAQESKSGYRDAA
jgi:hypothetical protein